MDDSRSGLPQWGRSILSAANELVVLSMAANPEPNDSIRSVYTKCPETQPYTHRPETADPFEVQRRVALVCLEKLIISICKLPNLGWKQLISLPEIRRGEVLHKALVPPEACA